MAERMVIGYLITAFRSRRDRLLFQPDYSQIVLDEPGQPPATDRADALRRELVERSARNGLGWRYITCTPLADQDDMPEPPHLRLIEYP